MTVRRKTGSASSVAMSGTIAIVGARCDDDNGDSSGSAYLFDTTTGQQIAKLLPMTVRREMNLAFRRDQRDHRHRWGDA